MIELSKKNFKKSLKEASEWHLSATEDELTKITHQEAKKAVLKRIFKKYKDESL